MTIHEAYNDEDTPRPAIACYACRDTGQEEATGQPCACSEGLALALEMATYFRAEDDDEPTERQLTRDFVDYWEGK